jgi:peptide/nickel transport system permease protein
MATAVDIATVDTGLRPAKPSGPAAWPGIVWTFTRRKPLGAFGALVILLMLMCAIFVDGSLFGSSEPLLAPYHYNQQVFGDENLGMSWEHPLGTDKFGRDIFSRILYGARISVVIGLSTVTIAALMALALGTVSGYFSGWFDTVTQRLVDILLAIPPLVLLIYGLSVFAGRSGPYTRMTWIIIIVAIVLAAAAVRVVRGATIATANNPYVDAARTIGATSPRIIFRHIVPNVVPVVIVLATVNLGVAILAEAAISFLGLGIPEPFPSWGAMLSLTGSAEFRAHPEQAIWPGLAIAIAVYSFNMFGDALRDVLDPRLRGSR